VARFKPGPKNAEAAAVTPADFAISWVELMNYHAFLPVEEAYMVGHLEDIVNVLKEDAQWQGTRKRSAAAENV